MSHIPNSWFRGFKFETFMQIRFPKQQLTKLLPVPEKQKQSYGEKIGKHTGTFKYIYRDKTNCNYNTANINGKQRPQIKKYLLLFQNETTNDDFNIKISNILFTPGY